MKLLKNKEFARFARRAGLSDTDLCSAASQADRGIIDADLGGGVIKQRIARRGKGKSGGFRTIVLFKINDRAVFVYGFAKNERSNISLSELTAFRKLAAEILAYDDTALDQAVKVRALIEIPCEAAVVNANEEGNDGQAI